jgi:hypothetical protein
MSLRRSALATAVVLALSMKSATLALSRASGRRTSSPFLASSASVWFWSARI